MGILALCWRRTVPGKISHLWALPFLSIVSPLPGFLILLAPTPSFSLLTTAISIQEIPFMCGQMQPSSTWSLCILILWAKSGRIQNKLTAVGRRGWAGIWEEGRKGNFRFCFDYNWIIRIFYSNLFLPRCFLKKKKCCLTFVLCISKILLNAKTKIKNLSKATIFFHTECFLFPKFKAL